MRILRNLFFFFYVIAGFVISAHAAEITILYTGETHSMIYRCSCPRETDGGIARRAALLKQLRAQYPDALVVDSGGFFGGGLMDEHTQNIQLDMARTEINLKGLALMRYDALAVGDDEFNFGREYFFDKVRAAGLTVVSCNIGGAEEAVKPYIVKDVRGIKVGIIGVSGIFAAAKAGGLAFSDPVAAVASAVKELKGAGAVVIILLSHLGESADTDLINAVEGIDVVVVGHGTNQAAPYTKIGKTLLLRPSWQGRRLGKAVLKIESGNVAAFGVEDIRISDKIPDDPQVREFLPRCFADAQCKENGQTGTCLNGATMRAECVFAAAGKVRLTVVGAQECFTCNTEQTINYLRGLFPGLQVNSIDINDRKAAKLKKDFAIQGLPAYFLGKEADKEKGFEALRKNVTHNGDLYMLSPEVTGLAYFPNRAREPERFDVFLSLYDSNTAAVLEAVNGLKPRIHFLAVTKDGAVGAKNGRREVEEDLRAVCVQRYAPARFLEYLSCRASNVDSAWWDDCASGTDIQRIKTCAQGPEGEQLLNFNTQLGHELKITEGPVYLVDNQQIFSSKGVPSKQEMEKIVKR